VRERIGQLGIPFWGRRRGASSPKAALHDGAARLMADDGDNLMERQREAVEEPGRSRAPARCLRRRRRVGLGPESAVRGEVPSMAA
jgi:hypothetical protein